MLVAVWTAVGVGVLALVVVAIVFRTGHSVDVGFVSERWVADHLSGPSPDR